MKNDGLKRKIHPFAIAGIFLVIVPWVAVFILDLFYIDNFSSGDYVYREGFCFSNPSSCQVIENTSGDLNFYCENGISGEMVGAGDSERMDYPAKLISTNKSSDIEKMVISYKGKNYELTTKVDELKKMIKLKDCEKR